MRYISTRNDNNSNTFSFEEVLFGGLATDGGLYLPQELPKFTKDEIVDFSLSSYQQIAFKVIDKFVDLDEHILKKLINDSYKIFDYSDVAPLTKLNEEVFFLELFHSPTLAFKDYALQFLASIFQYFNQKNQRKFIILGATSGDTGSAAIHAFKNINVKTFILHPYNKVSLIQRKQMTTVEGKNIHNIAIKGNFDDCQNIVKSIFNNQVFISHLGYELMAVNSINWARIMSQIVYYFSAYSRCETYPNQVVFSVPTGNFGNILSGYIASKMGLPVKKFVLGTNENDILHRFVLSNDYRISSLKTTLSPSMDIVVSSNLERYLYYLYQNAKKIAKLMDKFKATGELIIDSRIHRQVQADFFSATVSDHETKLEIAKWFKSNHLIIDPHTAIAFKALEKFELTHGKTNNKKIIIGTAHPGKFYDTILKTKVPLELPKRLKKMISKSEKFTILSNQVELVENELLKKII